MLKLQIGRLTHLWRRSPFSNSFTRGGLHKITSQYYSTSLRSPSGAARAPRASTSRQDARTLPNNTSPSARRARRAYPPAAFKFINDATGFLETTQENRDWLRRTGISHDVGLMGPISDRNLSQVATKFACNVAYSAEWIIHPKDILHLAPRGSPLMQEMQRRYELKMHRESLWINATCTGDHKPVVKLMMKRRLKGSIHRALEAAGFDEFGRNKGPDAETHGIRGTISIHIYNPLKGLDLQAAEFGEAIVKALKQIANKTTRGSDRR